MEEASIRGCNIHLTWLSKTFADLNLYSPKSFQADKVEKNLTFHLGKIILNKMHSCVNVGFQYRTSGVIFRGLPYCDCHCHHAISSLPIKNNSTCVYFCLLAV